MFPGVRDISDNSVTGGGEEGVRNDNGGICTAEMQKKCFSFCHHVIPISLLTKMHRVNFCALISKLSYFFKQDLLFKVPLIPPTYHHIFLCVPFPRIWFLHQRHVSNFLLFIPPFTYFLYRVLKLNNNLSDDYSDIW